MWVCHNKCNDETQYILWHVLNNLWCRTWQRLSFTNSFGSVIKVRVNLWDSLSCPQTHKNTSINTVCAGVLFFELLDPKNIFKFKQKSFFLLLYKRFAQADDQRWAGYVFCHQPPGTISSHQPAAGWDSAVCIWNDDSAKSVISSLALQCHGWISDLMKRSAPARVVTLSSVNHKKGQVDFSHFHGKNLTYSMDSVYNHTKLHNIICTNELARRLQGTGTLKSRFFRLSSFTGCFSLLYCVAEDVQQGKEEATIYFKMHILKTFPACSVDQ